MDKIKRVLLSIGAAFIAFLVGLALWLRFKDSKMQPEIAAGYDPLRDVIDEHFEELGRLDKSRLKLKIQRMQIETMLPEQEIKDFRGAIRAAVDSGDNDELTAVRQRYLARYDIHRQADVDTAAQDAATSRH